MKFTPNSKIRGILFVKPLSETSFPRFSGRGEQLQIRVLGNFYIGQILEFCNTYYGTVVASREAALMSRGRAAGP